jgi:maltose alpha-D-glucosyltransferase/alpha-amylase
VYELHVRAFADSDGDGIGDLRGLTRKLDYLQDLGVTAIWLLPFYPSPLRDEGYDISDYRGINPTYGNLRQFRQFLVEAHRRDLRVITELVLNHTSDQHPWFQRARSSPRGSRWRNWYVWSDDPSRYRDARIIFRDFERSNWAWDDVAGQYFWHRFYSHQPDLNFDNPEVRREMLRTVEYWLEMGVDGLRLDAVPYLFEREGTSCENLPETHDFLKEVRRSIDARFPDRMLLAEANQWPEDAAEYFGEGDECQMAFHFPLMPRLFMGLRMEDRFPIVDILRQTPTPPDGCQWAVFLRNHDELTLEMVTDEERDYMYSAYAHNPVARINLGIRRRLAPLLQNHRHKIELMHALLCSLPGTPVLYYGDEIGMGDNVYLGDRDSVRTPMQWSADRNAGFSEANPQRLYLPTIIDPEYSYESVNVDAQLDNPDSLLWWVRRLIALRRRNPVFAHGTIELLSPDNHRVLAFLRRHEGRQVLVVANLSRYAQYVELDLHEFRGAHPVELFGQTAFPAIGDLPYLLTLGPHAFYWLALEPAEIPDAAAPAVPPVTVTSAWTELLSLGKRSPLDRKLPQLLSTKRWFGSKGRKITSARVVDSISVPMPHYWSEDEDMPAAEPARVAFVRVEYADGEPETYALPLAFVPGNAGIRMADENHAGVLFRVDSASGPLGVVMDAHWLPGYGRPRRNDRRRPRGRAVEHVTAVRRPPDPQDRPAARVGNQSRGRARARADAFAVRACSAVARLDGVPHGRRHDRDGRGPPRVRQERERRLLLVPRRARPVFRRRPQPPRRGCRQGDHTEPPPARAARLRTAGRLRAPRGRHPSVGRAPRTPHGRSARRPGVGARRRRVHSRTAQPLGAALHLSVDAEHRGANVAHTGARTTPASRRVCRGGEVRPRPHRRTARSAAGDAQCAGRVAHPGARRPPSRSGALDRTRLGLHRLRG